MKDAVLNNVKRKGSESNGLEFKPQRHCSQAARPSANSLLSRSLNYPLDNKSHHNIARGRCGIENGYLGDNSYYKASEKVLPQAAKTSSWSQTSIIRRPCRVSRSLGWGRGRGGRVVYRRRRERREHQGVPQTWEQEKPPKKQQYWLESTARHWRAAAAIADSSSGGQGASRSSAELWAVKSFFFSLVGRMCRVSRNL